MDNFDDSESSSNLVALTLGKAMHTEIKHIAYCYIRKKLEKEKPNKIPNIPVISCLGKDSVFMFRENFQKVFLKFPYSKIDHVIVETLNKYTLMIVFNEDKDFFYEGNLANDSKSTSNGSLPYIHLTIPDRNYFIENLMCYYSVYHISEKKVMKELVIKRRERFLFNQAQNNKNEYKKLYNKPPTFYKTLVNVNYIFYAPEQSLNNCEQSGIIGGSKDKYLNEIVYEFNYSENVAIGGNGLDNDNINESRKQAIKSIPIKSVITVKLMKLGSITTLDSIEISKEKNFLTNNQHILQLYAYEQFRLKYYEKIKKNKMIILSDEKYLKKYNLSADTSEWEGRAIKSFDLEACTLVHFFYIRRKFIPPFCNKYQDFIISCTQNLKIFEEYFSPEEFEAKRINYILAENFELNKNLELFINSVHNIDDNRVRHYSEILHFLYDTLSLDYNSLQYFTNNVEVIGKEIYLIGLKFVYFILKEIKSLKVQIKIQQEKEMGFAVRRTSNPMITGASNAESDGNTQQTTNNTGKEKDVIIPVSIEDFLERIEFLMELYVEKHDKLLKEKREAEKNNPNIKDKKFKSLRDATIEMGVIKWVFKEIQDEFMKHAQSSYYNDFQSLNKNWNIRIKKFLYFCLNGGLLPGTIDISKLLELMDHHIDYDRYLLRDVIITLLFFDDRVDPSKFSLSTILSYGSDLVFNHDLLCLVIEKGYIDVVFSANERSSVFSGEILTFLLQNIKSFEIINAVYVYVYFLINPRGKYPHKVSVIIKQRQNIIKELFEVFRDENVNPYIIIKITMLFNTLIYLEQDQLKTITALVNKNIVDVIANKLNSNNLNLILGLSYLLKALTNKIEASNVKSSFTKNIDSLIKNVTKLIQLNKYFRNSMLVDNLLKIHINFLSKGNDSQKFYLVDIKNAADKQKSLVGTLMNLLFENVFPEENFVKSDAKMNDLKSKFRADINILLFFQCLIKNNKQMKIAFKDKMELDFFCCGVNANSNFSVFEPKNNVQANNEDVEANNLNTQNNNNKNAKNNNNPNNNKINFFTSVPTNPNNNNTAYNNNNNNMNLANNNKNESSFSSTKFNNKIKKINSIIKNKILIQSSEHNAFQTLVKKYRLDFIVNFYQLVSNIIEFCFYLLNDEDTDHKKSDNSSSYVFSLKELCATIGDLIKSVPHAVYHFDPNDGFSKPALDRLVQAHEALNRHIEGQGEN